MANSTSTPEQSKNTADPPGEPKPYIEPVPYEDLIAANRRQKIDTRSEEIIVREEGYVRRWRSASGAGRSQHNVRDTLAGLALSGGGIRSATFALGVSQALAAKDKMRRFDYLSTVSGGGYFGSSLTWLTRADDQPASGCFRFGMDSEHFPYPVDPPGQQTLRRADPAQDAQLIYLRQHGKYLAPGRGIDLVSGIAVVLRGFLLNLLVWLPIAALLLLVLLVVPPLDTFFPRLTFDDASYQNGYGWMAVAAALASVVFIFASVLYSLATYLSAVEQAWRYHGRRFFESKIGYVLWFIVATGSVALMPFVSGQLKEWLASAGFASVLTGLASAAGTFLRSRSGRDNGGLAMSVVAPIGAILTLYGVLILAYVWAGRFYGCTELGGAWPWIHRGICSSEWLWWPSLIVLAVALVTGHFVNVNFISVHRYYRTG